MGAPASLTLGARCGLGLYGLAWALTLPALKKNPRLAEGWEQRVLATGPLPRADLWVQAASGGEAYLAWELLRHLPAILPEDFPRPRVLVTTFTSQGLGVLERAREALCPALDLLPAYVPFDRPGLMRRALRDVSPRAVVLLETELWPGLLAACREQNVPALVLNARMTDKSLKGYTRLPWLWRPLAPRRVLAVSGPDAGRFARVFPQAEVGVMSNIKFDRLRFDAETPEPEFARLLPRSSPFVVLGSVRKEEEPGILEMVKGLLAAHPDLVVGLFPRHVRRVCVWERLLAEAGVPFVLRSEAGGEKPVRPGSVLLWDVFGELGAAFSLARAAFLGGSLAPLGGQNFLEPLAFGVVAVTGPSWSNFAWVGEEVFSTGLVRRARDWRGALDELCALLRETPERSSVRACAEAWAAPRRGGALAACQAVAECLFCA